MTSSLPSEPVVRLTLLLTSLFFAVAGTGCATSQLEFSPHTWSESVSSYDGNRVCTDHGPLLTRNVVIEELAGASASGTRLHSLILEADPQRPPTRLTISEAPGSDWLDLRRPDFLDRPVGVAVFVMEMVAAASVMFGLFSLLGSFDASESPPIPIWNWGFILGGLALGATGLLVLLGEALALSADSHPSTLEAQPCSP